MGNRTVFWALIALLGIATLVGVGYYAYSAGVAHGIAESGRAATGGAAPVVVWPWWGFHFGFLPFFPLLFLILLWAVLLRGLFWRGSRWGGGCGYRYGNDVPRQFEEWHRRAHGPPGTPPASGTSNV